MAHGGMEHKGMVVITVQNPVDLEFSLLANGCHCLEWEAHLEWDCLLTLRSL